MRRLLRILALVPLLLAPGAFAQEPSPEAPAEAIAEILAIPIEVVSDRAEQISAELQSLVSDEVMGEEPASRAAEIDQLKSDIASRVASAGSALAGEPSGDRLDDLERQLIDLRERLAVPVDALDRDLAGLRDARDRLEVAAAVWEKTASEARAAGAAAPTLRRIGSVRQEIDQVGEELASHRNRLLERRDALVNPASSLDQTLARVREAIGERAGGAFSLDGPPIWSPEVREALREELSEGWSDPMTERLERLALYVKERQHLIFFQGLLFVLLAMGLRALGSRAKARAEERYDLREAEVVFASPTNMALLIVLGLTRQIHPFAPSLFEQLAFTAAVFPAAVIVHRLSPPAMTPLVLCLPLLFLADRARGILETIPAVERLLFFAELAGALAFLLWLVRPSRVAQIPAEIRREPFLRVVAKAVRVAIGLFALALVAEAVGLGSLAQLVGNGSLMAAYSALFAYALLKVLQSLVAYALVLRPLRLLRLVSNNRRRVRRRLDRALELLIALGWLYYALSIFGIAGPVRSAAAGLLGASLSVGKLSVSLGDLFAFGLTAWLSFQLARFVDFVLQEDVFPRTSLPRGVPYAVSSLVRYVLIFLGFLLALAAAGIQLSNLTVIAGGLGVGIGFGLQNVVNNFVSGLILLFERPLNVGDTVGLSSQDLKGEIRRIGIRASVIRTWDGSEVIVPNGQLISESVVNWTLSDARRRVEVDVGVEYGTDAQRVLDLLLQVAREHPSVLDRPEPNALFLGFGDSSLDFRLRAWIESFEEGAPIRSEMTVSIQAALAEAGITVPFPQRDLHLRSVSPDAASEIGTDRGSRDEEA